MEGAEVPGGVLGCGHTACEGQNCPQSPDLSGQQPDRDVPEAWLEETDEKGKEAWHTGCCATWGLIKLEVTSHRMRQQMAIYPAPVDSKSVQ